MQENSKSPEEMNLANPVDEMNEAELDEISGGNGKGLDSSSEMGELESLRLQMAMERKSKMQSNLSKVLKKISDTGGSITQNIK